MKDDVEHIRHLDAQPFFSRTLGYLRLMGPGYMQSAMTLGGGTAFAAIFAGAAFGYQLLWVAPVAMLLGIVVLAAVAHQTLSTGENPFQAMKRHAGPFFAYGWAFSGIFSSIIWQFAQYALASAMLVAIAGRYGWEAPSWLMGLVALAWCVTVAMLYDLTPRLVRTYEAIIKGMVWFIIACFGFVVIRPASRSRAICWPGRSPSASPARTPACWARRSWCRGWRPRSAPTWSSCTPTRCASAAGAGSTGGWRASTSCSGCSCPTRSRRA